MQITYTDTEIATDNPFPAGMVDIRASQDLRSNLEKDGFTRWISTLSGTMRWGKNVPRSWAWGAFAAILAQRFQAKANAPVFLNNTSRSSIAGRSIPIDINISEELFDREANFSVSWATVVDLNSLFQTTKMFQPLQNLTWAQWHSSLTQLQSPQGGSNMTEKANDIKVVDVCGNQVPALPNTKIAPLNSSFGQAWFDFSCGSIRPEASWLDGGTPTVRIINDSNALPQIPAYGPDATTVTPPDPSHTARSSGSNPANTVQSGTPAGYEPTYQTRSYNTYMIEVRGSFTRVCYEPYEPVFTSYGGVDLVLLKSEHTVKKTNGQFFPIYTLDYVQTYYLERLPEGSPHLVLRHDAGKGDR